MTRAAIFGTQTVHFRFEKLFPDQHDHQKKKITFMEKIEN